LLCVQQPPDGQIQPAGAHHATPQRRGCAAIDAQARGNTNEEQWYSGTIRGLLKKLGLEDEVDFPSWWKDCRAQSYTPVDNFVAFIDQIRLEKIQTPIVIFVEEVGRILSLPFDTDSFFSSIRSLHERRAERPIYRRLTFCFLGVATPDLLIRNRSGSQPCLTQKLLELLSQISPSGEDTATRVRIWCNTR